MKLLRGELFDRFRVSPPPEYLKKTGMKAKDASNDYNGFFIFHTRNLSELRVIAANGGGWDHVSVSLILRTPTWEEMDAIHRRFFKDDEIAFQLHMPLVDHINIAQNCLHLWRPHKGRLPLPPKGYV